MVPDFVDQDILDNIPVTVLDLFDWGNDPEQLDYEG